MRRILAAALLAAFVYLQGTLDAGAQQTVVPYVPTGTTPSGTVIYSPVGANLAGAVPMPANSNQIAALTVTALGTTNGADLINYAGKCAKIGINITSITGAAPTFTVSFQGKDTTSGTYYTILASAALATTGFTLLTVCPSLTAAANSIANDFVPSVYRVIGVTGGTISAIAATVGVSIVE